MSARLVSFSGYSCSLSSVGSLQVSVKLMGINVMIVSGNSLKFGDICCVELTLRLREDKSQKKCTKHKVRASASCANRQVEIDSIISFLAGL